MGYNTNFSGVIEIRPRLSDDLEQEIIDFCEDVHDGKDAPARYCDWTVDASGGVSILKWNRSEKSYAMDKWLSCIITEFLAPNKHVANGVVRAQGSNIGDVWKIVCKDNVVTVERLPEDW